MLFAVIMNPRTCSSLILTNPLIRDYFNEVVRWEGLKHRHKEVDHMLITGVLAAVNNNNININILTKLKPTMLPFE